MSSIELRKEIGTVKRDFGSFQSSNVQELIELPRDRYVPPVMPIDLPSVAPCNEVSFGKEMKSEHFLIDDKWTYLNHGAFGLTLKKGLEAKQIWEEYIDSQPLRFMDRELLPLLVYVVRLLADYIDSDPSDVVVIPNVSYGMNTVIKSLTANGYITAGSKIIYMNLTYGSTKTLLKYVASTHNLVLDEVVVKFPLKDTKEVIKLILDKIDCDTKLVIVDHIPSNYGLVLPVKEIVQVCHEKNVQVLVDGAHALGMLDISMRDISADYYVSNAHKWFCNPKGCGFLYVNSAHHSMVRPLVVSHGFGCGFTAEFLWSGLMDYTSYLSLLTVLQFWKHYNPQVIRDYIRKTSHEAAMYLVKEWQTHLLSDINQFCGLTLVALPTGLLTNHNSQLTYDDAELIQNVLHHKYMIEVPVKVIQGELYVRVSVHIYNDCEDYHKLGAAVNELVATGGITNNIHD